MSEHNCGHQIETLPATRSNFSTARATGDCPRRPRLAGEKTRLIETVHPKMDTLLNEDTRENLQPTQNTASLTFMACGVCGTPNTQIFRQTRANFGALRHSRAELGCLQQRWWEAAPSSQLEVEGDGMGEGLTSRCSAWGRALYEYPSPLPRLSAEALSPTGRQHWLRRRRVHGRSFGLLASQRSTKVFKKKKTHLLRGPLVPHPSDV